ncbi:MAG: methyltransferase domain-containing protein [Candidatus Aenigmarchaeota archaeon]|nr:methyltransferase domain-containing protein [Candidatus Aenigmarchaeota archaeon]
MEEKELVLLIGPGTYLVQVGERKLNTEHGTIDLLELEKKKFGDKIKTHTGKEFTIIKPSVVDILMRRAKRLPQIVTPKDASMILAYTGISPDSLIVDSGSGSGFLSIFLACYCNQGKVVTYEKRKEFTEVARKNIELVDLKNILLKEKDILKGIDERDVDLITLDMEDVEKVVEESFNALKPGGWLVVYSPHIEQVISVRKKIEKMNFTQVKTVENITREWRVGKHTLPEVSGVLHTGWLTFARKIS